ncbi:MAG: ATP-binding protein [Elusimicrobia bacterium]|nr:ATP-binding protein [Elusimicrobiota bacterium]
MNKHARNQVLVAGLILLTVISALMLGMAVKQDGMLRRQTYNHAAALHDLVLVARRWNASHGGAYLGHSGPGGKEAFERIGPEAMTREISELARGDALFSFHIASLDPLNPDNAADAWERTALEGFARGEKERAEVSTNGSGLRFRLMKPIYVEQSCLACHAQQGYRVGDVRGGISVSLPYDAVASSLRRNFIGMIVLAVLLLILFVLTLYFLIWRLMESLSQLNSDLASLNETKDRFLGMAAHDLRTPLAGVVGLAQLLQEEPLGPEQRQFVDGILASSERMLSLITDLLDVAKINRGRLDLNLQDADVAPLLSQAAEFIAPIAKKKGIALETKIAADAGSMKLDSKRILQVLDNLLSNAIKYSKAGTTVTIGAERSGGRLSIWVQDQGVGIAEKDLPKLFLEFSQTDSRPTAGEESHGLGLAIAKRLVELHGGTVHASSAPGKGSRFTIELPVSARSRETRR